MFNKFYEIFHDSTCRFVIPLDTLKQCDIYNGSYYDLHRRKYFRANENLKSGHLIDQNKSTLRFSKYENRN